MDNTIQKLLVLVVVLLYIISPVDAYPGPIDDVIVTLLGIAARKKLMKTE